jgi:ABC-type multidrug transport system ATPase subunit
MRLDAEHLEKRFGATTAVAEVSFTAAPGAVLGLLGPNGAGKSTTVGMLAGLLRPDRGSVRIGGVPLGVPVPTPPSAAWGSFPRRLRCSTIYRPA